TLPEHAESGEERFTVEWHEADAAVWYDILAFSRPQQLLARCGYPIARRLQKRFARDSAAAMQRAVGTAQVKRHLSLREVPRPLSITAPVVSVCARSSPSDMMCWTITPFATRKSLTSRRWHCQNSPSAHMMAVRFRRATSSNLSTPSR